MKTCFFSLLFLSLAHAKSIHSVEGRLIKYDDGSVVIMPVGEKLAKTKSFDPATSAWLEQSSLTPSVISSLEEARRIFKELNPKYKEDSQCYNRAHVWANETFEKYGYLSQKSFIFFSNDFILRNNFQWWFHVAPLFTVNENGVHSLKVMDHLFSNQPLSIKQWTDLWVKNDVCLLTTKYSDYVNKFNQQKCYVINTSMYYWQPKDIEAREHFRVEKTEFFDWEIELAYQEAFAP